MAHSPMTPEKPNLGVILSNIQQVQSDVRDIKLTLRADYVTRLEHNYLIKEVERGSKETKRVWKVIYTLGMSVILAVVTAVLNVVIPK